MDWESVAFSVLTSLLASVFYLVWMRVLRPNIVISELIAVRGEDGNKRYVIKVINRGSRIAVNLKAELSIVSIRIVPDGVVHSTQTIPLQKDSIFTLAKLDRNDDEANYAYRFATVDDIASKWSNDSTEFLRFKLYAHDEVSNFGKLFVKDFRTKRNTLKDGEFRSGNSLEIA